jgi:hypothetical protein
MNRDRRNTTLAVVIGAVLAGYAGSAAALEFEMDNGTTINWNTTLSVGASWRAEDPSKKLYTRADGALIGKYGPASAPIPGTDGWPGSGIAGNQAGDIGDLNYGKGAMFSMPYKLISDVEVKNGRFGGLLRIKAWYDEALNNNKVRIGNAANNYNGTRPGFGGPTAPNCFLGYPGGNPLACIPMSPMGQNLWPKGKLSDAGFEAEQKFDNLYLLDAYVYGSFAVGDSDLQLRLGNQVINWGESLFIQGVNQINPIDVPAARRAGAEVKEILLPIWSAYANWGFSFGSVEAFYQFKWNNTSIDGCDTYWAGTHGSLSANPGRCGLVTVVNYASGVGAGPAQLGSEVFGQATGQYVPLTKGVEPKDSGQFGFAFRFPVEKLDTEFGLYAMNIHARTPVMNLVIGTTVADVRARANGDLQKLQAIGVINASGTAYAAGSSNLLNPIPAMAAAGAAFVGVHIDPGTGHFVYVEDQQIYGLSAATNLWGWAVGSELSYQANVPVPTNGNDFLTSFLTGAGPMHSRALAAVAQGEGTIYEGWDKFDKTQFQVSTIKTFANIVGADQVALAAEVGAQWNNVPDYKKGGVRYGRNSVYGLASGPDLAAQIPPSAGNTCSPSLAAVPSMVNPIYNSSPMGCKNDGFVTDFAWGYRLRVSGDYYNVFGSGVTATPSVFWSQDVKGVSLDPTFNEGRDTLGLGLKLSYNKKYTLDLNWVSYANNTYDPTFDRDYYSVAASVTF